MIEALGTNITARVSYATRQKFYEKCATMGERPSSILRELLDAFVEDRITITLPTIKKEITYVPRNID